MSRSEMAFLGFVVAVVIGFMLLTPTVPRGWQPAKRVVDWSKVHDDPSRKMTITWMGSTQVPTAHKGTWIEKYLDQKFNLDLDPTFIDWDAYANRRPLVLSSGDIPDVNWDSDPLIFKRNVQQGFVMELPYSVILKYAPTYAHQVATNGPASWLWATQNGKNFGIPTFASGDVFPNVGAWRMDWLRKVGINKVPETLDEFHEALKRFRDDDPDGDGRKDTYGYYPFLARMDMSCNDIYSAYDVLPQDFMLQDGKIVWGGITPRAKQALTLIHQWYAEGLINPDCATTVGNSSTDPWTEFLNGRLGYMILLGNWEDMDLSVSDSTYTKVRAINPKAEMVSCMPLIGIDGKRHARVWGGSGHVMWFGRQCANDPAKVIRVLRMFEAFATDRNLYITAHIGKQGLHWDYSPTRGVYRLPPYDQPGADLRNMLSFNSIENCYGYYSPSSIPLSETESLLPRGEEAFRMKYANPAWGLKDALGSTGVLPSAGNYLTDLNTFQSTAYIQMIRGDKPMSYFDEFVREWRSRGGDVLTTEANEQLGRMHAIYRQVGVEQ